MLTKRRDSIKIKLHRTFKKGDNMNKKKIGETLIMLRGKRTLAEVADALNISISALSMYERGHRVPRDEVKQRIARYYKRSVNSIFYAS